MQSLKGISVLFLLLYFSIGMKAQLNFKTGYVGSYFNPEVNNTILQIYNEDRPWLSRTFNDVHYFSGLVLGARYRFEFVAVDVSWYGRFKRNKAEGIDPTLNTTYERLLNYNINSYSVGIENFLGNFSLGGSIDLNKTDIRTRKTGREDRFSVVSEWSTGSTFFLSYNVKSTQLQISIRPYVQVYWTDVDLAPLAEELEVNTTGDQLENFMNYGIMLIFFNGPQSD